MCTGVEYISREAYNNRNAAAPVKTSGDGDGGGTVGNGYSNKPLNATGIGTDSWGKTDKKSKSTMTTAPTRSTSRTTGLNIGGQYSGGLY